MGEIFRALPLQSNHLRAVYHEVILRSLGTYIPSGYDHRSPPNTVCESSGFQSGSISLKEYIATPNGNGPLPAVIFMHGGRGSRVGGNPKGMVEAIAKAGFIGFAWIRSLDLLLAGNVQETIAAIDYVKDLKNVDVERLAVIGFSRGGLLAFMASV